MQYLLHILFNVHNISEPLSSIPKPPYHKRQLPWCLKRGDISTESFCSPSVPPHCSHMAEGQTLHRHSATANPNTLCDTAAAQQLQQLMNCPRLSTPT